MSKAEERALEAYPVFMTTLIPADDEHPLIEQDCNKFTRKAYLKGYHQAEKDLQLTWEDVEYIIETYSRVEYSREFVGESYNDVCKEVLKRFKERKEK